MNNAVAKYPLSPVQEGMLFHALYDPQGGYYVEQIVITLPETLDVPMFAEAWQRLAQRHPVLRTRFIFDDGATPFQEIVDEVAVPFSFLDWHAVPEPSVPEYLTRFLEVDRRQGFDPGSAPLMRVTLIQTGARTFTCIWTFHHALLDGRVYPTLLEEVFALYEGRLSTHATADSSFADYVAWLNVRDHDADAPFWREFLAGYTVPVLPVMATPGEGVAAAFSYGKQTLRLSKTLTLALTAFAQTHGCSLSNLVQAAWALLLSRYCGVEDVILGVTLTTRQAPLPGAGALIGPLINTLPLRVPVPADRAVSEWLRDVRARWVAVREHAYTSLVKVQGWRDVSTRESLFETLVMADTYELNARLRALGGAWEHREVALLERTNYPLALGAYGGECLTLHLTHDRRRYNDEAVVRLLHHLQVLMEGLLANPQAPLRTISLLDKAERDALLTLSTGPEVDVPEEVCVYQLFEHWAAATPNIEAVVFQGRSLTYGQLNRRANALAARLIDLGVAAEVRVGICAERSLEMIVAILAVLKAGGAYVPLDPDYPPARLHFMAEDSDTQILLIQRHLLERCAGLGEHQIVLEPNGHPVAGDMLPNPNVSISPDNLCYVFYTSGSTGKPKGVMITHRNVVAFLHSYRYVNRDAGAGLRTGTMVAPFCFDTSIEELYNCICFGGAVHIIPPELSSDVERFAHYLVDHQITTAYIVPDFLAGVAEHLKPLRERLNLRCVITGLAPKKQQVMQAMRDVSPDLLVLNAYGPTEVTYGATAMEFQGMTNPEADTPIGRPFPNYQTYVVDTNLRLAPVGAPGELLIGGMGLARGYLARPELTQEKFILNPFEPRQSPRVYRSGDLVRWLPDGNLDFLGRRDRQVKIRGYRIELGEIEAALEAHSFVQRAVVMVHEPQMGDKRIVAYVVPCEGHEGVAQVLRDDLTGKLPKYMVPSFFIELEALPLQPTGKLDRRALPAPGAERPEMAAAFVAPRTPVEEALAAIWRAVLGVDQVGVHDNFFDLGGHSLLAVQVVSRVRQQMGIPLRLPALFEAPTVAELAKALSVTPAEDTEVHSGMRIVRQAREAQRLAPGRPDKDVGRSGS